MKLGNATLTWFDLLLIALVIFGIFRGRKRGMSEEMLDVFQWLCIIVVGAMIYAPIGQLFIRYAKFSPYFGNITAYALVAVTFKLLFNSLKKAVGEKLVQSDAFGRFEYYLGMMAGALRMFCVLLFCLSFLHAKHISEREMAATAKMQAENFGSISFPTLGSLQQTIFAQSPSGKFIKKHLRDQMVQPVAGRVAPRETLGKWRERSVEEVFK